MHVIKIGLLTLFPIFFCFLNINCRNNAVADESADTKWIIQHENEINSELSTIISQKILASKSDTLWIEKSFVITEYDTTILGALAKRIKQINKCFEVMYTYSRKMEKRKRITIIRDPSGECLDTTANSFSIIDSTRYLKISFDTLHK